MVLPPLRPHPFPADPAPVQGVLRLPTRGGSGMTYREPTVADLIEQLNELPQDYPASIVVNGTLGVITGVWCQQVFPGTQATPYVLIGERETADAIVPPEWTGEAS